MADETPEDATPIVKQAAAPRDKGRAPAPIDLDALPPVPSIKDPKAASKTSRRRVPARKPAMPTAAADPLAAVAAAAETEAADPVVTAAAEPAAAESASIETAATPEVAPVAAARVVPPAPVARPASQSVKPAAASQKTESPAPRKEQTKMTTATEFTDKFQSSFKDASEKAKAAFGDMGAFAKGNVEAMLESSKIFAAGLQEMGKGYVAESKTAMESLTAEFKELTTVKSPTEFFEKQSALLRKQFDAAVATSSKNSEAMLKLANEAFQPISTRVSLAVEKMKQAA